MSIAISAVLCTPVGLLLLQAGYGLCAVLAAFPLAGGHALGWPAALASGSGGVLLLALLCCRRKPLTLDISPVGQIRLAEHEEKRAQKRAKKREEARGERRGVSRPAALPLSTAPLRLLPGSTLWPSLLVLRLADGQRRVSVVLVQRGRFGSAAFRELAVACQAIAARGRES